MDGLQRPQLLASDRWHVDKMQASATDNSTKSANDFRDLIMRLGDRGAGNGKPPEIYQG
jgi:hypothetical protein